jgi:hypothetical protein
MEFKYLGSLISNNNNSNTVEINHRILLGNRWAKKSITIKIIKQRYYVQNL